MPVPDPKTILALDAGTTGVRAIVFDTGGSARASAYRELETVYPEPGRCEQDLDGVWTRTREVIDEALGRAGVAAADVAALGIANQRSSVGAWESETLQPVSPMLTWQDSRGRRRADELQAEGFFVTANVAVTKAEWIVKNVPDAARLAASGKLRLGGVESWLVARLTGGRHVTDHSNASATGFYAHFEGGWEKNLLAKTGVPESAVPELVDSSGTVASTDPAAFGAAVPLAGICGDQQASLFGLGCFDAGTTKCSYGTSAMVDTVCGDSLALGGANTYPLVAWKIGERVTWAIEGSVITAGAAVQWLRDGLGVLGDAAESAAVAASMPDSGGAWAVPAFEGIGTPLAVPAARATIGGISRGTTRAHVVRAVLEGIAHRVADAAEAVWHDGPRPDALRADGGASRNDLLMQMQADFLGMPVECAAETDGSALGAAMLAAEGAGLEEARAARAWRPARRFEPSWTQARREEARANWARRIALVAGEAG